MTEMSTFKKALVPFAFIMAGCFQTLSAQDWEQIGAVRGQPTALPGIQLLQQAADGVRSRVPRRLV